MKSEVKKRRMDKKTKKRIKDLNNIDIVTQRIERDMMNIKEFELLNSKIDLKFKNKVSNSSNQGNIKLLVVIVNQFPNISFSFWNFHQL